MQEKSVFDSVNEVTQLLSGESKSPTQAIVNLMMSKSLSLSMMNAATAQQNAQMLGNAATAATIAQIVDAGKAKPHTASEEQKLTKTSSKK